MTFNILWACRKKDGAGKSHLWGILEQGDNTYIFWGSISRVYLRCLGFESELSCYYRQLSKIKKGYKQISSVESISSRWPEIIQDIEMQFVVRTLKNTKY